MTKLLTILLLLPILAIAGGPSYEIKQKAVQTRVYEGFKSADICNEKIKRYEDKQAKYLFKENPSIKDDAKLAYYTERLDYWQKYCSGKIPAFPENE